MPSKTSSEVKYGIRSSTMLLNEVYFWTDTIKDWKKVLESDNYKNLIVDSWRTLIMRKKICVYAFVIMPNHLHMVWEILEMNGKETAYASFNKFTSHAFLHDLKGMKPDILKDFQVDEYDRKYRFWQRDPLAVRMYSKKIVEQKINYIHMNPLNGRWNLAARPEDYKWSSAGFYETGADDFGVLTDYRERF